MMVNFFLMFSLAKILKKNSRKSDCVVVGDKKTVIKKIEKFFL
jgi:hypothetical protein